MVYRHAGPRAFARRTLTLVAALATLLTLVFATSASARVSRLEVKTVRVINAVRAHYGLHGVRISRGMSVGADRHSLFMARHRVATHGAWASRVSRYAHSRTIGEVIAWISGRGQAGRVVRMWLNSPPHRAVLLNGRYRRVGIARRSSHGLSFFTVDFAR
jgi:uncharacterized protein YkwD